MDQAYAAMAFGARGGRCCDEICDEISDEGGEDGELGEKRRSGECTFFPNNIM